MAKISNGRKTLNEGGNIVNGLMCDSSYGLLPFGRLSKNQVKKLIAEYPDHWSHITDNRFPADS